MIYCDGYTLRSTKFMSKIINLCFHRVPSKREPFEQKPLAKRYTNINKPDNF